MSEQSSPEQPPVPDTFPADRWRRAGASDAELAELGREFAALPPAGQQAEATRVVAGSDYELRDRLETRRPLPDAAAEAHSGEAPAGEKPRGATGGKGAGDAG